MSLKEYIRRIVPDKLYLKYKFYKKMKKQLNLDNPQTFNEKLQWLKLYDRNPEYTKMVDKYEVKKYVAEKIGEEYIIPTLGVWNKFEDIDFERLPNQFVLKCTHDSGGVVICKDKSTFDFNAANKKLSRSLKRNYFWKGREWPYKNVKPRIIAEKYISNDLIDYKFMCFNGNVKCSFVCTDRFSNNGLHVTFFDRDWNVMPFERHYPHLKEGIPRPKTYGLMLELSEKLSTKIPFVRVDFYEFEGNLFFGELTFYPGNGLEEFTPEEWDYRIGNWINLVQVNEFS